MGRTPDGGGSRARVGGRLGGVGTGNGLVARLAKWSSLASSWATAGAGVGAAAWQGAGNGAAGSLTAGSCGSGVGGGVKSPSSTTMGSWKELDIRGVAYFICCGKTKELNLHHRAPLALDARIPPTWGWRRRRVRTAEKNHTA